MPDVDGGGREAADVLHDCMRPAGTQLLCLLLLTPFCLAYHRPLSPGRGLVRRETVQIMQNGGRRLTSCIRHIHPKGLLFILIPPPEFTSAVAVVGSWTPWLICFFSHHPYLSLLPDVPVQGWLILSPPPPLFPPHLKLIFSSLPTPCSQTYLYKVGITTQPYLSDNPGNKCVRQTVRIRNGVSVFGTVTLVPTGG